MSEGASAPFRARPAILLGLTGLDIDGGIASVNRCIVRVLDERVAAGDLARVDRVVLESGGLHAVPPPRSGVERRAGGVQARFVLETWALAAWQRPDLVFFDHVGPAQAGVLPLPGLAGRRRAVFVHGGELAGAEEGRRATALRQAWRIVANSEHTAGLVTALDPALADHVRVATLCIDPERVAAWQGWDDASAPPVEREPAALIVGRMAAEERGKGHEDLIAIWPEVLRAVPEARLWIAGGGDDRERLERVAGAAGGSEAVHFLGRISEQELHQRMYRASLLAMPSRQEGFGLVYAEAGWHGMPSIGSTADAARCVIRDGETGSLVPYGDRAALTDSLVRLLRDRSLCRQMGRAARADAEERFVYPRFRAEFLAALDLPVA